MKEERTNFSLSEVEDLRFLDHEIIAMLWIHEVSRLMLGYVTNWKKKL